MDIFEKDEVFDFLVKIVRISKIIDDFEKMMVFYKSRGVNSRHVT